MPTVIDTVAVSGCQRANTNTPSGGSRHSRPSSSTTRAGGTPRIADAGSCRSRSRTGSSAGRSARSRSTAARPRADIVHRCLAGQHVLGSVVEVAEQVGLPGGPGARADSRHVGRRQQGEHPQHSRASRPRGQTRPRCCRRRHRDERPDATSPGAGERETRRSPSRRRAAPSRSQAASGPSPPPPRCGRPDSPCRGRETRAPAAAAAGGSAPARPAPASRGPTARSRHRSTARMQCSSTVYLW